MPRSLERDATPFGEGYHKYKGDTKATMATAFVELTGSNQCMGPSRRRPGRLRLNPSSCQTDLDRRPTGLHQTSTASAVIRDCK
jgi:hypothetical protein